MPEMIRALDIAALHALAEIRSESLVAFFSVLSVAGDAMAMLCATLIGFALLVRHGHRALAIGLFVGMVCSTFLTALLKQAIAEARPDALYSVLVEPTYAFPSGHTSAAFAFFGFLAYVALTRERPGFLRKVVVTAAVFYPTLMAFGRLYLGVHYVSDVIAGCVVGLLAAAIGVIVANWLKRRGV
ncbi:phosphatase PAP2 family protein [Candidatus Parcubacteria bacterium]|nr:MAG: phosphatase PAP2 family protein [Candidatus Parcubacteria bacterium]